VRRGHEPKERPDAGLRRFLGVDPAVEETLARAGLDPVRQTVQHPLPFSLKLQDNYKESVQSIMGATENNFSFFPISYRTYRSDRFAILRSSRMCLTSFDLSTHGVAHQRRPVTIIVRTGQDRRRAQALLGTPVPQARQNPRIETVDQPAGQVWTTAGGSPLFSIRKDMDR
jgi:hypothetical protein